MAHKKLLPVLLLSTALLPFAFSASAEPQSYQASKLHVDGLIAALAIETAEGGAMSVSIDGKPERVAQVHVEQQGDVLLIRQDGQNGDWWEQWFDWSNQDTRIDDLRVTVTLPKGTPVDIDGFIGSATVGDLDANFSFEAAASNATIGSVTQAKISVSGSGEITMTDVAGKLEVEIAGSGNLKANNVGEADVEIAGHGEVEIGNVASGLEVDIAGSGELKTGIVGGRIEVSIAGSGDVTIDGGRADPLEVDIAGSGDFRFGGEAVNPEISVMGSGDVWLKSYSGTLSSDGADIKIGG